MASSNSSALSVRQSPVFGGVPSMTASNIAMRYPFRRGVSSPFSTFSPQNEDNIPSQGLDGRRSFSNDEDLSPSDPRRLTPNLHASLVSEILSLRREIEGKNSMLESLEEHLQDSKKQNVQVEESLKTQNAEVRSVKKQMHILESSTMAALEELAKERDTAIESLNDARKRLESSRNQIRAKEEEAQRVQEFWEGEKQSWDVDRRRMDHKVHVAQGRLKTVLAEVAAVQPIAQNSFMDDDDDGENAEESWAARSTVKDHSRFDSIKNDTTEENDVPTFRSSTLSGLSGFEAMKLNNLSLAEELEFGEEQQAEAIDQGGNETSQSAPSSKIQLRHQRLSLQIGLQDESPFGIFAENNDRHAHEDQAEELHVEGMSEKAIRSLTDASSRYADSGTQYTPPSTPKPQVQGVTSAEKLPEPMEQIANQRRKRISMPSVLSDLLPAAKSGLPTVLPMVSAGCQTVQPLSPPPTPVDKASHTKFLAAADFDDTQSSTTQTDDDNSLLARNVDSRDDRPTTVPTIAIHPPASRPASSRNSVVLPPRTKNASCQTSPAKLPSKSISVQTEDIRLSKRGLRLPPRLPLPHVPSRGPARFPQSGDTHLDLATQRKGIAKNFQGPVPTEPPLNRRKVLTGKSYDAYPGDNDNGPLTKKQASDLRRPIRIESLFAGFDEAGDPKPRKTSDKELREDDFTTVEPIRKTLSKVKNSWKLVPRGQVFELGFLESDEEEENPYPTEIPLELAKDLGRQASLKNINDTLPLTGYFNVSNSSKDLDFRRAALVTSAAAAHGSRTRSPSEPSIPKSYPSTVVPPPFPVPTRSSSRRIPISASEGADSPTPYSSTFSNGLRKPKNGKIRKTKASTLRKVQSAAVVSKSDHHQAKPSQSPSPSPSTSTIPPPSPKLPPLPHHNSISQATGPLENFPIAPASIVTTTEALDDSSAQSASVVDAIAQTMVGEWMWKYVRRRKSFGVTESARVEFEAGRSNGDNGGNGNGVRHKRWVWLAPYERAILWSGKQPTSGLALLGKSGRKLAIQSVIDVKDDTPVPKNSNPESVFNKSILILTPERALKFTATSRERHEIWLTALSYLSESDSAAHDLTQVPPLPPQELRHPASSSSIGSFRRGPIRDSIRIAKSKVQPRSDVNRSYTTPIGIPQRTADQTTLSSQQGNEAALDAAEPPFVPRVSAHTHSRKRRSNRPRSIVPHLLEEKTIELAKPPTTGPKTPISHDSFHPVPGRRTSVTAPLPAANDSGRSVSGGSQPLYAVRNDFFDAVGTVRMEAFIDRAERGSGSTSHANGRKKDGRGHRIRQARKKDLSYWGVGGLGSSAVVGHESRWKRDDPFQGF